MSNDFEGKTICVNCKHMADKRGVDQEAWCSQYCSAAPKIITLDYALGRRNEELPHCRDVNIDGKCKLYEEK